MADLLPPNATRLERNLARAGALIERVPVPLRDLANPAACPVSALPFLAASFSVDHWEPTWSVSTKRAVIQSAFAVHKDADAKAGGAPLKLTHMVVGDGAGATPSPELAQTQLVREVYRAPLNQLSLDPINSSQVIAECVIPEKSGGWWIREVGLLDADGDLVAVANCPPSYKPQMPEGSARTQVIRMVLIVSSAETVQLSIDPGIVMATRDYADSAIARAEFTPVGGTVPIRVEEKLKQTVSMLDLGGAGNFNMTSGTGTNNFQRLIDHVRAYNDCPVVHFPFVTGETNVYYFKYERPYTFGNGALKIRADKGVVFYCDNVSFDCESNETVIAKSPFKMGMSYLDKGDTTFPQPLNKKSRFIGHGDLVKPMVRAVNPAQEFHTQVLLWPGTVDTGGSDAEVLAASANVALHDTAIVFDSAGGSGVFEGGGMRLRAGQRLSARVAIPAGMANFRSCVFLQIKIAPYAVAHRPSKIAAEHDILNRFLGALVIKQGAVDEDLEGEGIEQRNRHGRQVHVE